MVYLFSDFLNLNYDVLDKYLATGEEIGKSELLDRCSGKISYELLQGIKELEFEKIGKSAVGDLYLK